MSLNDCKKLTLLRNALQKTKACSRVYGQNDDFNVLYKGSLRFTYEGRRITGENTPAEVRKFLSFVDLSIILC